MDPGPKNSEQLEKMVDLVLQSNPDKSNKDSNKNTLVNQPTVNGDTPLALALCHPHVTKKIVKLLADIEYKALLFALNLVASRLHSEQTESWNSLESFLKQLIQNENEKKIKQILHIVCRHDNVYLLEQIFSILKVSIYLNCNAHLYYR